MAEEKVSEPKSWIDGVAFDVIVEHFNGKLSAEEIQAIRATMRRSIERRTPTPVTEDVEDGWQPIETAPKDGTWILAQTGQIEDERWQHITGRCFVVRHMGTTDRLGLDLGWALFPGMGVPDEWLAGWRPLPVSPSIKRVA